MGRKPCASFLGYQNFQPRTAVSGANFELVPFEATSIGRMPLGNPCWTLRALFAARFSECGFGSAAPLRGGLHFRCFARFYDLVPRLEYGSNDGRASLCPRSQGFVSLCSPSLVGHGFGSVPLHSALNPRCCALSFHCGHGFSKAPLAGHPPFPFAGTFRIAVRPFPSFSLQLTLTEPLDQFLRDAKGTGRGGKLAAGHPLGVSQLAPLNLQGQ